MHKEKAYPIDKAAHLLGVQSDALRKLIDRDLVEQVEENGELQIPHREIARLYGKVEGMLRHLPQKTHDDHPLEERPERVETPPPWTGEWIEVHDPELIAIHERIQIYQERLNNLTAKVKRLGVRAQRVHAMAQGDQARFMERASALYPQLWNQPRFSVEKMLDHIVIRPVKEDEGEEYRNRLGSVIREGIEKGMLPNGFLGMVFQNPDADPEDDDEDDENDDTDQRDHSDGDDE